MINLSYFDYSLYIDMSLFRLGSLTSLSLTVGKVCSGDLSDGGSSCYVDDPAYCVDESAGLGEF